MVLVLPPSEYQGEANTAVAGRVVLCRQFNIADIAGTTSGKGQGKSKGSKKGKADNDKCEVHLLGGGGMQEMLFIEAWGASAETFRALATLGALIRIENAKVVPQRPKYSTSKLQYYLRIQNPIGVVTRVQTLDAGEPWASIPQHHPFVDVGAMRKVPEDLQCCVLAVVTYQPGAVHRMTSYGESQVCNALLRLKDTTIRTSFWRQAAASIATFPVGSKVALYQVTVKKIAAREWELRATHSTRVEACPLDLEAGLEASTDLSTEAVYNLTQEHTTDYETVNATVVNVGSLVSLLMPHHMRDLAGVYELHSLNVLGISAVLNNGSFCMRCCSRCKKQVEEGATACPNPEHDGQLITMRWIGKITFGDGTGTAEAVMYHDALAGTELFPESEARPITDAEVLLSLRKLRSHLWSARVVYNRNEVKQENSLEVKLLTPTFTFEGLLASWSGSALPEVCGNSTCPFASCAEVVFDTDLGVTMVQTKETTNVRLLVRVLKELEDEDSATGDGDTGLRVTRRIVCAADKSATTVYKLTVAGLSRSVQWLLRATADSLWMVLASKRGADDTFVAIAYEEVTKYPASFFEKYIALTYQRPQGPVLVMGSTDTPLKRRKLIDDAMPRGEPSAGNFATRLPWEDV